MSFEVEVDYLMQNQMTGGTPTGDPVPGPRPRGGKGGGGGYPARALVVGAVVVRVGGGYLAPISVVGSLLQASTYFLGIPPLLSRHLSQMQRNFVVVFVSFFLS